jgi:hypothetical protein
MELIVRQVVQRFAVLTIVTLKDTSVSDVAREVHASSGKRMEAAVSP